MACTRVSRSDAPTHKFERPRGGFSPGGRRLLGGLALCAAVGSGAYLSTTFGQALQPGLSPAESFQQTVLPVLSKNCMSCHSDRLHTGNLSLEAFKDPVVALQHPDVWLKVLDKLNTGAMPPRPMAPVSPGDRAAVIGWIEKNAGAGAIPTDAASADPGRVTARRLNRAEYNNTIRDLLGVSIRPADEFPVDDAGYGFDNIGDVLSLSPLLMEKYMNAAQTVSKVAIYGESYLPKPAQLVRLLPKKFQDDTPATGNVMPYSLRGAAYGNLHVPVDAEYEFRFRYYNYRGGTGHGGRSGRCARARCCERPRSRARSTGAGRRPWHSRRSRRRRWTRPHGGAGAGRGGGGGVTPRPPPTPEARAAALEAARNSAPPEPLVFALDGATLYSYRGRQRQR